ncbi:DinB family protein [Edaphobacter bradus]|uniref:DinB family protein n=1 Tax=Edaphobacter bradus TaxID=2259016 RepID=UPI0021DFA830|nr:DinB family protein [Edaphobacter bradus]
MGLRYTQGTEPALLEPAELGERLEGALHKGISWLVTLSEADACVPEQEGKWSAKEVMGHLTDSAVNNLGRIVRMQGAEEQNLPGYDQEAWVERQDYRGREWAGVLGLWFALNEHIAWTIRHVEKRSLANEGVVAGGRLTLGFLIEDYVAHMEHHLRALQGWVSPGMAERGCKARPAVFGKDGV